MADDEGAIPRDQHHLSEIIEQQRDAAPPAVIESDAGHGGKPAPNLGKCAGRFRPPPQEAIAARATAPLAERDRPLMHHDPVDEAAEYNGLRFPPVVDEHEQCELYVRRIRRVLVDDTVAAVVKAGRYLIEFKQRVPGRWGQMFTRGGKKGRLPIDQRTANMYMAIARHRVLSDSHNYANSPTAVIVLYELSRLPEELVEALYEDGKITAHTTLKQVLALPELRLLTLPDLLDDLRKIRLAVVVNDVTALLSAIFFARTCAKVRVRARLLLGLTTRFGGKVFSEILLGRLGELAKRLSPIFGVVDMGYCTTVDLQVTFAPRRHPDLKLVITHRGKELLRRSSLSGGQLVV